MDEEFSSLEKDLMMEIKKRNLTAVEVDRVLNNLKDINPRKYKTKRLSFPDKEVYFGYFSDAHMGHKHYRRDIFDFMAKHFKKEKVDFVINAGDTIEGMSNRDGHVFELDYVGMQDQMKFFQQEFEKLEPLTVYSIEADSSHGGWSRNKGNQGFNVGEELHMRAPNYEFIGFDEQDLLLDNRLKIRLRHPGGGVAYAISYKMQKYVESISGGNKPSLLFQGHFHKYNKMFYRNVHCWDAGCLQQQSPFMKKKGTPAHLGYGLVRAKVDGRGRVKSLQEQFIPFYD